MPTADAAGAAPARGAATPAGRGVAHRNAVRGAGLLLAVGALAAVALVSLAVGSKGIPLSVVGEALFDRQAIEDHQIVWNWRVPRTVVGIVVGMALGVAGALIQALTRNPLADPGILGVNAGAAFAVSLGVAGFGVGAFAGYMWFAFAGAVIVTAAVYLIGAAGRGGADPIRVVLAGVALGAVLTGVTSALTLMFPRAFDQMRYWAAGSIVGRDLDVVWPVLPFIAAGVLLAAVAARPLNAVGLGDDMAAALGAHVARTRVVVIVAVTFLAGGATAIAGPIAFVGLMIPHVARWIVGPDQRWILAYTAALAPILLLVADIAGRLVMRPGEVPVGVVTAFVGAPVLIVLVRRRRASTL